MAAVEPDSGRAHGYDNGSVEVSGGTAEAENGTRGRPVWCVRGGAGAHAPAEVKRRLEHWLPGEKPVSVLFETLTDSSGGAFVIYLLGGVV
uniref:Uncharacterized protein n=1 Tax=Oryza barthii TaxID=65489 RepID=A0A0D3GR34_9ORYZ